MARYGVVVYQEESYYYEPTPTTFRVTKVGHGAVPLTQPLRDLIEADVKSHDESVTKGYDRGRVTTLAEITGERLARLNPSSAWPGDARGGGPETTQAEIAGALAYGDPIGYELCMANYVHVGGQVQQSRAFYEAYAGKDGVMDMMVSDRWDSGPKGKHWYRNLTALAILELTEVRNCMHCNGAGRHAINGKTCGVCGGGGKASLSDEARAEAVQIPFLEWKHKWRERYEKIYRRLQAMEASTLAKAGHQLRRAI